MRNVLHFKRLDEASGDTVELTFEGEPVTARAGETVAAALLAAGHISGRQTPVSGSPRGPYCMMGACFDCLVVINGVTEQACMIRVAAGQVITRAHGKAHD